MLKNDGGSIVNISSVVGRVAGRGYLAYGTAKAALAHYTRLAAQDLSPTIRVNAIAVGSVMTSALEFVASDEATMNEMTTQDPARRGSARSRTSPRPCSTWPARAGGFVTGKVLEVDGGLQSPTSTSACPTSRPATELSAERYADQARRRLVDRAPSAGTRSPASTPDPTSSWSASGSPAPDKDGKDAGELAGLGRELGVAATNDKDALLALEPDCIVHTAMADDRIFEAIDDLIEIRRGRHQRGLQRAGAAAVPARRSARRDASTAIDEAGAKTGASLHVNGIDPGFANDVLPLVLTSLSPAHRPGPGQRDRRLLDLLPARRDARHLRLRQADGRRADALAARHPDHGLGPRRPPDRRRPRPHPRRAELEEIVEREPADRDLEHGQRATSPTGTMGAVRFQVVGKVDGVPRVVLEHVTRTHVDQMPEWPQPPEGGGCYRVEVEGEPMMRSTSPTTASTATTTSPG